jgi:membrane-bound lytic murein transglycosylase D
MRKMIFLVLLAAPLISTVASPYTIKKDTIRSFADDTTIIDMNFDENLDSLLNLYYVEQSLSNNPDSMDLASDSLIPDFNDSIYMDRLKRIPTVVDLTYNPIVRRYIEVYTRKKRSQVEVMLGLCQYYFPIFDDIFDYYDIPNEMKYMSIIESALNPRAYSRTRAVGLWQFMYGTGKQYGLTINSLVDERRDPIKSTNAAARYVKDLYAIYNDWTLVIAAYNCGPGNVNRAIRRSGGKRNYWEIYNYLPRETRGHVPAFIAATYMMNYYREHYLKASTVSFPIASDTIMITRNLHMAQVSEVLGVPLQLLHDMNPQYRTDIIPAMSRPQSLRLPLEQTARFIDMADQIYSYKDSIYFNPDKVITIPSAVDSRGIEEPPPGNYAKLTYTVKAGDNLGFISEWYNARSSDIRYWNNIRHNTIRAGQHLSIYVPRTKVAKYQDINQMSFSEKQTRVGKSSSPAPVAVKSPVTVSSGEDYVIYKVKQGDTIWDIMKKYPGVTETEIMRLNNMSDAGKLKAGQQIKIRPKS